MTFEDAWNTYQIKLKSLFEYHGSGESADTQNKLDSLIDGLSSVTTVKEIRAVANNLKDGETNG